MADYTLGLTAAEIDAALQGIDDGSLIPAINKIKTSQFVVEGTTGDPLPTTSANDYLVGAEMAFGWVVTTDVVDAVIDANGNLTATSGVVEYTFDKADNATPNAASLFASVMRCTDAANSVYVQDYADGSNGISLVNETATTITLRIDFSSFAGGKVFGVSEQLGKLHIESTDDVEFAARGYLLIENSFGTAKIYRDGSAECRVSFDSGNVSIAEASGNIFIAADDITVTLPISFDSTNFDCLVSNRGTAAANRNVWASRVYPTAVNAVDVKLMAATATGGNVRQLTLFAQGMI